MAPILVLCCAGDIRVATLSAYLADITARVSRAYSQNLSQLLNGYSSQLKWWVELEGSKYLDLSPLPLSSGSANARLSSLVSGDGAFLAARLGLTEVESYLLRMRSKEWGLAKKLLWEAITLTCPRLGEASFLALGTQSGFYSVDSSKDVFKFLDLYSASTQEIDLLVSWLAGENFLLGNNSPDVTSPQGLEPFFVANPWTKSREGKSVLVIHPFTDTIRTQYEHKTAVILRRKSILPEFQLRTIKVPITLNRGSHWKLKNFDKSWFINLSTIQALMERDEFDIAIVGAGAYGLPLGTFAKKIGRKAVVMGGATKLLFGIRGRRWEGREQYARLMNSHWVRPQESETSPKQLQIEGGAYW